MPSSRFHKAAKDGLLDILKEASRKDINAKDSDSMTPVLWASFEGRLDALRLLCGRGGDPDKCDQFGNTALHLAAAKGHLYCVDFLIKFGVNYYALDIDRHSAKDLAAINNRHDILRFLDAAIMNFETNNRKKSKVLKELAEKQYEKRMREFRKCSEKDTLRSTSSSKTTSVGGDSMLSTLTKKIWCKSQGNLSKSVSKVDSSDSEHSCRSASVEGSSSCERRRREGSKTLGTDGPTSNGLCTLKPNTKHGNCNDKTATMASRTSSIKPTTKLSMRESSSEASTEHYFSLARSRSTPYIAKPDETNAKAEDEEEDFRNKLMQRPLFGRRPLDSLTSRRSVAAALNQLPDCSNSSRTTHRLSSSICSKSSTLNRNFDVNSGSELPYYRTLSELDGDDLSDDELHIDGGPLMLFLSIWGLEEFLTVFQKQQIDLDTLMLLTEDDLRSLELPLGPFRKLHFAIQERRNAFANPGPLIDTPL